MPLFLASVSCQTEIDMDIVYLIGAGLLWLGTWALLKGCERLQGHGEAS